MEPVEPRPSGLIKPRQSAYGYVSLADGDESVDVKAPTFGSVPATVESYCRRRLQLAGGSLFSDKSLDGDFFDYLKSVYLRPLDTLASERLRTGRELVSFANYDYAALAEDVRVKAAACDAIMNIGIGAGASRLVGGERAIHAELERDIARFLGVEDSIALVSGYLTNISLLGHFLTKNDLILVDDLSHNSVIVGTDISRAQVIRFAHNDLEHLNSILAEVRGAANRALIVVEGLYSMDGDVADLPRLLEIKEQYGAWLMVDDAHGLGVLGRSGRGSAEHFGIDPKRIDILVGTMSKTLASCGGFVAGNKGLIDSLRFSLPAFVFSVGISPALAAAVREAIKILATEPWRVSKVQENSQRFLETAKRRGLDTGPAIGAGVVSIMFSGQGECLQASQSLLEAGYFAPPILQLAVPKDQPRIRFFISARHTAEQISGVVDALADAVEASHSRCRQSRYARKISGASQSSVAAG